jgi:hypothetical protein
MRNLVVVRDSVADANRIPPAHLDFGIGDLRASQVQTLPRSRSSCVKLTPTCLGTHSDRRAPANAERRGPDCDPADGRDDPPKLPLGFID